MANRTRQLRVTTLPPAPLPATIYYVAGNDATLPDYTDAFITDNAGVPHAIGNVAMINSLITQAFATLQAGSMQDVATIAARDAKLAELTANNQNAMVLVRDATGDASVASGGAFYYFDADDQSFTKTSEFAEMDIINDWDSIIGKPTSTPAAIDAAVGNSHTHANQAELDKIGEDATSGNPTYDGDELATKDDLDAAVNSGGAADAAQDARLDAVEAKDVDQDAAIAALEADSHTHANQATLDLLTGDATTGLQFNGEGIVTWDLEEW